MKNLSNGSRPIPFQFDGGLSAKLTNPSEIKNWTTHHGMTKAGVKVNSLSSAKVGDSIFIKRDDSSPILSVGIDELEVFVIQQAVLFGYTLTPAPKA
jgi:hypothetical protein